MPSVMRWRSVAPLWSLISGLTGSRKTELSRCGRRLPHSLLGDMSRQVARGGRPASPNGSIMLPLSRPHAVGMVIFPTFFLSHGDQIKSVPT